MIVVSILLTCQDSTNISTRKLIHANYQIDRAFYEYNSNITDMITALSVNELTGINSIVLRELRDSLPELQKVSLHDLVTWWKNASTLQTSGGDAC